VVNATIESATLTSADRCDRCGARAYIRVVLPGGGDLLFCAHHGRSHEGALRSQAIEFHDETDRLTGTPASAPDGER
jgi:hypothetical protein